MTIELITCEKKDMCLYNRPGDDMYPHKGDLWHACSLTSPVLEVEDGLFNSGYPLSSFTLLVPHPALPEWGGAEASMMVVEDALTAIDS